MTKSQFELLLVISIIIFSIWKTLIPFAPTLDVKNGYSILWFAVLYLYAAYLRLYGTPLITKFRARSYFGLYVLSSALILLSKIVLTFLTEKLNMGQGFTSHFYNYNSTLVFLSSVFLFLSFLNLNISNQFMNNIIRRVSPFTLGVYLIHEHPLLRDILWKDILHVNNYVDSRYFLLNCLLITTGIFLICLLGEMIRKSIFDVIVKLTNLNKDRTSINYLNDKFNTMLG